jgi:hypothetical protein
MERALLVSMAPRPALLALLVAFSVATQAGAQIQGRPDCADYHPPHIALPNGYPFDVVRAVALFRFHRQQEALQELDAGRAIVRGPWRWRIPDDQRKEVASGLDAFRNCLATTEPPGLATLRVRVLGAPDAANNITRQAGVRCPRAGTRR